MKSLTMYVCRVYSVYVQTSVCIIVMQVLYIIVSK